MRHLFLQILLAVAFALSASAQPRLAMLYSSSGMEYGTASRIDADSNYIQAARFQDSINVNPTGTTTLTAPGSTSQIALTKYNRKGQLLWAKSIGSALSHEVPYGVACDAAKNIFVTGHFGSKTMPGPLTSNFDPAGSAGGAVTTKGNEDCFVAKYDKNGVYKWAFGLGNTGANTQERGWDLTTDGPGNVYVAGALKGTVNFNPLGTAMNYTVADTLVGLFVAKYNTNGICQWVIKLDMHLTSVEDEAWIGVDYDGWGNLLVAGNFRGAGNFNPLGTGFGTVSSGLTDGFLASYSVNNGQIGWVQKVIASSGADKISPGGVRVDVNTDSYVTGQGASGKLYFASYNSGGMFRYTASIGNVGEGTVGHRVAFDSGGNVYLAGTILDTVNLSNGIILYPHSSAGDVFVAKFNNHLNACSWAFNFGGEGSTGRSTCRGLVVDQENNLIVTGQLYGTHADVDPSADSLHLSSMGNNDCFLIKYTSAGLLWGEAPTAVGPFTASKTEFSVSPNPATEHIRLNIPVNGNASFSLFNSLGKKVMEGHTTSEIPVAHLPNGVYILVVPAEGEREAFRRKVIKE